MVDEDSADLFWSTIKWSFTLLWVLLCFPLLIPNQWNSKKMGKVPKVWQTKVINPSSIWLFFLTLLQTLLKAYAVFVYFTRWYSTFIMICDKILVRKVNDYHSFVYELSMLARQIHRAIYGLRGQLTSIRNILFYDFPNMRASRWAITSSRIKFLMEGSCTLPLKFKIYPSMAAE